METTNKPTEMKYQQILVNNVVAYFGTVTSIKSDGTGNYSGIFCNMPVFWVDGSQWEVINQDVEID